jgi:CheY-like chemotaxis protein
VRLDDLTPPLLNRAVDIYLRHAFDETDRVNAPAFEADLAPDALLARFEEETDERAAAGRAYVLRLGSQDYPHMKLALWEAYFPGEYILAVDCHDGFHFDASNPGYQEWLRVKDRNRQRKQYIESAWYDAGLDTLRRLKETALSRTECVRRFREMEVLLVDDDPDASGIIRIVLENRGFRCRWARTIREARAFVADAAVPLGLALVDIVMCDGNGVDIVRALRAEPRTQDVPVVLSSAMSGSDVQVAGVHNYLRKPYSADELVEMVERIIREQYDDHAVFQNGDGA